MTGFGCQGDQTSNGQNDLPRTGVRPVLATKSLPGFINTVEFTH
jgi:hypothetical protein